MTRQVFKVLLFLKRRPGMSTDEFRDYYENRHRVLCEKYMVGALRYVRRYVTVPEGAEEFDFDVITELWFDNPVAAEKVVEIVTKELMPAEIIADEERVFDRPKSRVATVVECDSNVAPRT